jgi:predicted  nucleic acid-binding Zn-ribbon protein
MDNMPDVNAYEARIAQIDNVVTSVLNRIVELREGGLGTSVDESGIKWGAALVHHLTLHLESVKRDEEKLCRELRGICKKYSNEQKKLVSEQKGCKQAEAEAKTSLTDLEEERKGIYLEQGNLSRSIRNIEETVESKVAAKVSRLNTVYFKILSTT